MPTDATGMRSGKRAALLGRPAGHQRRVYAEPRGVQVVDRLKEATPMPWPPHMLNAAISKHQSVRPRRSGLRRIDVR